MKITIVGGGNIGTQFAVHCAEKNNDVIIYSSKFEKISKKLLIVNEKKEVIHKGIINKATNNDEEAFKDADLIFITLPAFMMNEIADKIYNFIRPGVKIAIIPGSGGGECAFKKCMKKGAIIFGLQRVPSVARLVETGKIVCATGYREKLYVASLPSKYAKECSEIVSDIFDMPCDLLPNYLNLTLTPSNQILHTTRLNIIFKNYKKGIFYNKLPLFYEDWNDDTSELLFKCDDEVQKICKAVREFDLTNVKSLKVHYESDTPNKLTSKIQSIKGFKGLKTPALEENGMFIPDLNSRYFTADFNYGLLILIQISNLLGIETLNMKSVWDWYEGIMIFQKKFSYEEYGIMTYDDFVEFYGI